MRLKIHDIARSLIVYNENYELPIPRIGETISFIDKTGDHQYLIKSVDWVIASGQFEVTLKVVEY